MSLSLFFFAIFCMIFVAKVELYLVIIVHLICNWVVFCIVGSVVMQMFLEFFSSVWIFIALVKAC